MSVSINNSVVFASQWTTFKSSAITGKSLSVQYDDDGYVYTVVAFDGPVAYTCTIWKGTVPASIVTGGYSQSQNDSDKSDFETNYKPTANGRVSGISQGAALASNALNLIGGSVTTSSPSYTTGNINPFSLTTSGALRIDGSGVTQPVSGTITANIGTTNGLALDATLTGGTQTTRITDGTNTATVKAASTAAVATDKALVVAISPNNPIVSNIDGYTTTSSPTYINNTFNPLSLTTAGALRIDGSATTQPVSGTVAATQSGTWTVQPGNTANTTPWLTTISQGGNSVTVTASNALKVDGSGVTQPVSGTITANIGTTNGLALDTSVNGLLVSQGSTTSGEKGPLIQGAVTTAAPSYTTAQTSPLSLTTAGALRTDSSATTQPVSGTVTSNQGTANTLANAWSTKITDATNGPVAVKAASTAAVATDPALVVAISPNNSLTFSTADVTASGTLNALNATASIALAGHYTVGMQLAAGTLVGTIVPEISFDGGTTWVATFFDDPVTSNKVASIVFGSNNTATARTIIGAGGASNVRVRVSVFTSGTATCNLRTSLVYDPSELFGGSAGSALPPAIAQVGGSVTTSAPSYTNATMNALSINTSGGLRVDGSGVTQPVSGTITANQGTANSLANAWSTKITDATNGPVAVKAASTAAVATDPALVVAISPNSPVEVTGLIGSSFQPDPSNVLGAASPLTLDAVGRLETHTAVTTDETSFRDDFTGSALTTTLTGTVTFTASSTNITGSGTTFTTQIVVGQWIKKSADAETLYAQVATVISDTQLTLATNYAGTTASTTGVVSNWKTVTATGGSITVASSSVSLASGTTSGQSCYIQHLGDYLPYTFQTYLSVSQRIANQTIIVGFMDTFSTTPIKQATIQFSGTTNTTLNFVTSFGSAAADTQTTAVTLPNAGTTNNTHLYKIDLSGTQACLSIDGILVATNSTHIPGPYDNLNIFAGTTNTGTAATSTTLAVDFVYFYNTDRVQIDNDFRGEPFPITGKLIPLYGTSGQAITITLASLANAAARASTVISNTTNLYDDVLLFVKITTGASGVSSTGYVNIFGYGTVDNGSTYPEGITGTDAAVTLTTPPNLVILAQINANTNGATKTYGPFSFCRQYGVDRLPSSWGIVVVNNTGATFNATAGNFSVQYQGINGQLI